MRLAAEYTQLASEVSSAVAAHSPMWSVRKSFVFVLVTGAAFWTIVLLILQHV